MSIEKSLFQAPQGISTLVDAPGETIEVEIESEGGIDIAAAEEAAIAEFNENLADKLDEDALQKIASDVMEDIKNDLAARGDWEKMYRDGVQLLGLKPEERTEPWAGACGVFHPMITEAVVRFQADTVMETFPAAGPVKTKIIGKVTQEKEDAATRVADDLNWQVTENMVEFRPEHERMLWNLPSAGSAFKKVYEDPALGRQTSVFVPAEDVILPYGTTDMITCPRITHRMLKSEQDVLRLQVDGLWRTIDLSAPPKTNTTQNDVQGRKDKEVGITAINDSRYTVYEAAVDLDLYEYDENSPDGDNDGIALPYVLTIINDGTDKTLSLRRNWKEDDPVKVKRLHFVHYQYIPGYGAYGFGLFHLIGGYAKSATSIMRQLVDAGTLSNLPGGLKSRGLRVKGDDTPIGPGEFRDVDIGSGAIKDNIMMLPYKEPSQVLAGLLDKIVAEAKGFASSADMKISDMSNQAPVGSTLALLERQLKVMSAVQARIHYVFKQELRLIADIVKANADEGYAYEVDGVLGRRAKRKDFGYVEIIPVSDPNSATMSQRVVQYQAVLQLSQTAPQLYDLNELHRQMLHVLGLKNVDKLLPSEKDMRPRDPVQENQAVLKMKPVKAFPYQDHESHIAVHMMAMQDPIVMQLIGQNPQAQAIQASMLAHIAEHVGFAYRNKMAMAMGGVALPYYDEEDDDQSLPPEMEKRLSQMMAQAAPMVLNQSKQMAAQQQAQKNAQDPVLQAQLQDEVNQKAEIDRKTKKDANDLLIAQQKLDLERQKLESEGKGPAAAGQEMARGQQEMALKDVDATEKQRMASEKHQQEARQSAARLAMEAAAKMDAEKRAQEQHSAQLKLQKERHDAEVARAAEKARDERRQRLEAHRAKLKQQAEAAKKPEPKK